MRNWLCSLAFLIAPLASFADEVQWTQNESCGLTIQIQTNRLLIRTIEPEDLPYFCALYGNPTVMASFATGATRSVQQVSERFNNSWMVRWKNCDPYSAMAVLLNKPDSQPEFIGTVVMGHGDHEGQSELAFLFFPEYWFQGYGKEAVTAAVKTLGPILIQKGYGPAGVPLKEIVATCRYDNIRSERILRSLGMHEIGRGEQYGSERIFFSLPASELLTNNSSGSNP
jgi:RimJ/RimL family protein N-acetyltransferase